MAYIKVGVISEPSKMLTIPNIFDLPSIGAGHDGYVFHFNGKAIKYLKYTPKIREEKGLMTLEKFETLKDVKTKRIIMPEDAFYTEEDEFIAYTMPFIHDYNKEDGALNILPGDFYYGDFLDAIIDLEEDFEELNRAGVVAREINRGSFLYDLEFLKMCDIDKYQIGVKRPNELNRNMLNFIIAKVIYYQLLDEGPDKAKLKALNNWIKKTCQSSNFVPDLKKKLEKDPTKLINEGINTLSKTL